jgi:hypothetical protein
MSKKQPLNGDHIPVRDLAVRARSFRGKLLVASGPEAVELDEVGALIFRSVDGDSTMNEISAKVSAEYDVPPHVALADCIEFVTELRDRGLIGVRQAAPSDPGV